MSIRSTLARAFAPLVRAIEGSVRSGPFQLPRSGGWLPADSPINWFQHGYSLEGGGERGAVVEACIGAYSQSVALCPATHWRSLDNGGRERVATSSLSRVLKKPNDYQSISDFMLNLIRCLYLDGNAYALALRNERWEIDELHILDPRQCSPQIARATGDIFFQVGGNDVISERIDDQQQRLMIPQRDVLHVKLNAYERRGYPFPLVGETPLVAAYGDIAYYEKMRGQQEQYLQNRASPSAVLTTDLSMGKDQVQALRDRWNEQSKGLHAGGVPILTHGLKVQPWLQPAAPKDMQLAELLKLTRDQIALVFRVPLAILGVAEASGSTTEQLYSAWLASGLGFLLNHLEEAIGNFFNLKGQPEEYVEFDTEALLRSARKDRIEMLVRGVQGGVYSPNEARAAEDLPAVEYGGEPRVQQQVVPLSAAAAIPAAPGPEAAPAAPTAALASHQAAVRKHVEAMHAHRHKKVVTSGAGNGAAGGPVIRKNGHAANY